MISWEELDRTTTPEGTDLTLNRRGHEWRILANGLDLMSSALHGSEEALATHGLVRAKALENPCVLVGGLGMGFTLRATLDELPASAVVVVAELLEAVVAWNRGPLASLAKKPLDDRRVKVALGDVTKTLRESPARFDAILLDVDNGPRAFSQDSNAGLYDNAGLEIVRRALKPAGILAVWSAWEDRKFVHRLRHLGFDAESIDVRARLKKGGRRHVIFLGRT